MLKFAPNILHKTDTVQIKYQTTRGKTNNHWYSSHLHDATDTNGYLNIKLRTITKPHP